MSMSINWATAKPEKRIKTLDKIIDKLNKGLERSVQNEKYYLDEAATELENSKRFGGKFKSVHLERMETSQQRAKHFADMRPPVLETVAMLQGFKKKEIQALHDRALTKPQKTRHLCFFF